jgi:cytochrome P450
MELHMPAAPASLPGVTHHHVGQGQAERATADQELGAERLLELGDRERDGRLRHAQTLGGGGHRARVGGGDEALDLAEVQESGHEQTRWTSPSTCGLPGIRPAGAWRQKPFAARRRESPMSPATAPPVPVPTDDVDPFDLAFLADPYDHHRRMRDLGPVVKLTRYDVWGLPRYASVHTALTNPDVFCSSAGVGLSDFRRETPWRPPSLLLEADPPDHTRARRAITQVLTPRTVKALRETFTPVAEELVEALVASGSFDAVEDLAVAFPIRVFPDAVGLEREGRENLLPYGSMVFNGFGPRNVLLQRATENADAIRAWIGRQCSSASLAPGGLGQRVHEAAAAEGYDEAEAGMLVRSFLSAGVDTTVHGIENAMLCFAQHPEQWDALVADPSLARAAFEETIRFESPVQTFFRTTTRDTELCGVEIPAGDKVLMFLASANRDPRQWGEDADRFDITRRAAGHVGFGSGIHACVGQMMARLEGELVLTALARRVRRITLDGEPVRQLNNTLRGLDSLPVTVEAL